MSSTLDSLLDSVKSSILNHFQQPGSSSSDSGSLIGKISDLFNQHKQSTGDRSIAPASSDPYGDPAGGGNQRSVKPASADPYGDPADQKR